MLPANGAADTTLSGWEMFAFIVSQGSRSGNPGLEDTTPLGLDVLRFTSSSPENDISKVTRTGQ